MDLAACIRDIPDFPKKGILFKDLTTLFQNPGAFHEAVDAMYARVKGLQIDTIVAIESRGFILGAPLAYQLNAGFVPVRKPGKLPGATIRVEYDLEYGTNILEIHTDAIQAGERVLVVDDLLATGGSAKAAIELVERLNAKVVGVAFLVELLALRGMSKLGDYNAFSIIQY
ncbi:MAG: adenine phosphoribosyltransferase [Chloroflexi bacterium]|nr:adenine phosphoribosyltransferase [Chloroflexota bacterium]